MAETAPPARTRPAPAIVTAALLDDLWRPAAEDDEPRAFAVLDAARDAAIRPALETSDCPWCCLYRGEAARTLADAAPYLVELDFRSRYTPWLLAQAWGKSWGVFLNTGADADLAALRQHLRKLVMARLPDGKLVYFRFYDPRVLRVYLPTCTPEELKYFFGPISRFLLEDEDGEAALTFHREGEDLATVRTPFVLAEQFRL